MKMMKVKAMQKSRSDEGQGTCHGVIKPGIIQLTALL